MAITLLLAAPKENRSANPNCRALIHKVRTSMCDCGATADELERIAEDIRREENAILDIYADRTGTDRAILESLMKEEKVRTANELLQYGFISKINSYNTNSKTNRKMSEIQEATSLLGKLGNALKKLKNVLGEEFVNYDHTDADGNVIFSTEAEDETLEVGMSATPDGTFELPDGRVVTILDGVITEINEPTPEEEPAEEPAEEDNVNESSEASEAENIVDEEKESLKNEVETLKAEIATLKEALAESKNLIDECKKQLVTNKKPTQATRNNAPQDPIDRSLKDEVREKLNKVNK